MRVPKWASVLAVVPFDSKGEWDSGFESFEPLSTREPIKIVKFIKFVKFKSVKSVKFATHTKPNPKPIQIVKFIKFVELRITACTHALRNRCRATDKPPFLPMSFPLRFLRSIGRHRDGHLGTRTEEASADIDQKGGSLPFSVPSPGKAPAAYTTQHPNQWARMREIIREPAAEMLGTMILILVGTGSYLGFNITWGCAAALGVWVSVGVSGGHINPAVTLCMAVFRRLSWFKAATYIFGQLIGAWLGALVVYANYANAINIFEGGNGQRSLKTAGLFSTYPLAYMSSANCFFDEFVGTFVLVMVVFSVSDRRNSGLHPSLVPLAVFFAILGVGAAFGMQTGYAINPARDLGPRIMTAMVGYGAQVFTFRHHYWIWGPIIGSCCGALVAGLLYDLFIFRGPESFVNRPNADARARAIRQGGNGYTLSGDPQTSPGIQSDGQV